jgi:hypothetical protein
VVPSLIADVRQLEESAGEAFEKRAEAMASAEVQEAAEEVAAAGGAPGSNGTGDDADEPVVPVSSGGAP